MVRKTNKYGWYKTKKKLHWWTDSPYSEIDVLPALTKDGWYVYYNNIGTTKRPYPTQRKAIERAYAVMKRHRRLR